MLADSLLPIVFWDEASFNMLVISEYVLVTKPHNKTPCELIIGRAPSISFMRPFGCPVTILNTLDPLGKFDGMAEEGFSCDTITSIEYGSSLEDVLDKMIWIREEATKQSDAIRKEFEAQYDSQVLQEKITRASRTNSFHTISTPVNTASASMTFSPVEDHLVTIIYTAEIRSTGIFGNAYDDHDLETLNTPYAVKSVVERLILTTWNLPLLTAYLIFSFLNINPTKISQALDDESWVEAMQEELLQFKIQKVWTLGYLSYWQKGITSTLWKPDMALNKGLKMVEMLDSFLAVTMQVPAWTGNPQQEGCQFLGSRLISWQCKKQTGNVNSTTEAEYIVALMPFGDVDVHKELGDRMERVATTAFLVRIARAGQWCQKNLIGDVDAQTRFEAASKSPMIHLSQEVEFDLFDGISKQFWRTTTTKTSANGEVELIATIDGQVKTITKASLKRHLKLEDNGGVTTLPNSEILE
ncbi:hypothetical protein Tco_0412516 [Tanacetum coccineum]